MRLCLPALFVAFALLPRLAVAQSPPAAPIISEPAVAGQIVNPSDVHMETQPFSDPDVGDTHFCSDWEIWTVSPDERVWATLCINGVERVHTHLGDGVFENTHADLSELLYDTDYRMQVRFQDSTGLWSAWAERPFRTGAPTAVYPLEILDVATTPVPQAVDITGQPVVIPAGAPASALRLDSGAGELLLRIEGNSTSTPLVIDAAPLAAHADLRVAVEGGSNGWAMPDTDLLFTDANGVDRRVVLPAGGLSPGETRLFWISETGASYFADASPTVPDFTQLARGAAVPWTMAQPGYEVEIVARGFELPVNIAFVPNPGPAPDAPYFYVSELYGNIKVVRRDFTVSDYATGLLNYNPTGNFPGSGEQGLAGLVVDATTGDLFVGLLHDAAPPNGPHYPRVIRLQSSDGGQTAVSQTLLLDMPGETMGQSHFISNLSLGPDGKLYVHMGDGFNAATALDLNSFRGKVLRLETDGSAPTDNPFHDAGDGITATDYIYAFGFRNPFGGAWRGSDGQLYEVENGPSVNDRLARVLPGGNYGWDGTSASMATSAIYSWDPPHAPVNIAFVQNSSFGGSGFPAAKLDHAFVTESGPTWATGPQARGKRIVEFVLDAAGNRLSGPTPLVEYAGSGKATAVGLAAGPDGLYFTDLYKDLDAVTPIDRGANVLRVRYVGTVEFVASIPGGPAPLIVRFTDLSDVPGAAGWNWSFGDGNTSTARNPWHTYTQEGVYDVRLEITGSGGLVVGQKNGLVLVGDVGTGLRGEYFDDANLTVSALVRIDPSIDFEWDNGSPDPSIDANSFSARWTGEITPLHDGDTTFTVRIDDGARLWVDDQLVVDAWIDQPVTEHSGTLSLLAGQAVALRLEYYEAGGGATAQLFWEHANLAREIVPTSQLSAFSDPEPTSTPSRSPAVVFHPNHPNPFNPSTTLRFDLDRRMPVELTLYDAAGRVVRRLVKARLGAGSHQVIWKGRDDSGREVASGVYFVRLVAEQTEEVRKLVLVR